MIKIITNYGSLAQEVFPDEFVHTFSDILGEAAGLVSRDQSSSSVLLIHFQVPFQPAKLIFVGINVLFTVRIFIPFVLVNHVPLISNRIRRLKVSAQATTLSLNCLSPSEASSNASKYIPRYL